MRKRALARHHVDTPISYHGITIKTETKSTQIWNQAMIIRAKGKQFKRGCIYYNTETDRPERVVTITEATLGTKSGNGANIEIHSRADFRSPCKAEIQAFLGHAPRDAKTAISITDAESTAIAYGTKVVLIANSDERLPKIEAAINTGNNRSLGQLIGERRNKKEVTNEKTAKKDACAS